MEEKTKNSFGIEYISCSIALVKEYGLTVAALYGLIWSKCQLKNKHCYASETQLGKELGGLSRQTVSKYIKILKDAGFIKLLPNPRRYRMREQTNDNENRNKFSGDVLHITCNHDKVKRLDKMLELEIKQMRNHNFTDEDFPWNKPIPDANDIIFDYDTATPLAG